MTMRRTMLTLVAAAFITITTMVGLPASAHADPPPVPGLSCSQFVISIGCNAEPSAPVKAITQVIDFAKDPLGYAAAAVMGGVTWMLGQVSALSNASTAPNLSMDFWVSAYKQAWAVGLVLFCFVLLYETLALVRRRITPDQFMATLGLYAPATLGAMLFGPMLFSFLIEGSTDLADGIIHSATGFGGGDSFKAITDAAADSGFGGGATGAVQAFLSLFFGLFMLIAAVLVYLSLCMQGLVIYLGTAVFAVGVVYYASTRHRSHAWSIPRMVITIMFSKCILFFVLGVCLAMATAATAIKGDGVSRDLALIVMATIGMLIAAFTPLILLKHAPILPGMGAGVGIGAGMVGTAAGFSAARGVGRSVKAGGSKLAAVVSKKNAPTPPPGSDSSGGGRVIDAPIPESGTSKAGKRSSSDRATPKSAAAPGSSERRGGGSAAMSAAAAARRPTGHHNAGHGSDKTAVSPPVGAQQPAGRQPNQSAQKPRVITQRTAGRQPTEPTQGTRNNTTPPTGGTA